MNTSGNLATFPPRLEQLKKMLPTVYDQFDVIRIYLNEYLKIPNGIPDPDKKIQWIRGENLTDNGKFAGLSMMFNHEYYFTLDDDILYPEDYVEVTLKAIKTYGCIITHHGRILQGLNLNYYKSHNTFRCFDNVDAPCVLDVCGTGVTAWDTRYFRPKGIAEDERQKMTDLLFSLAAAQSNKKIGIVPHKLGWIKPILHTGETIFDTELAKGNTTQNELANEIYLLKYARNNTPTGND
jgi:hypothetical protein